MFRRFITVSVLILTAVFITSCTSLEVLTESVERDMSEDITLLHISDLHIKEEKGLYDDVIQKAEELMPDIIFITGDSLDKRNNISLLEGFLSRLPKKPLKFAVPGNWEYRTVGDMDLLYDIYRKNGVTLLRNQRVSFTLKGEKVVVMGMDDPSGGVLEIPRPEEGALNLILSHRPGTFKALNKALPDNEYYVFSGHSHGGQVTFFGIPLFLPPGTGDYVKGKFVHDRATLYVSKGIGNSTWDFRLFAAPDVYYITFR